VDFAINNLPRLIVDENGRVVNEKAFKLLVSRTSDPTIEDVVEVLEETVDGVDPSVLDDAIRKIEDWKVKLAIAGGLAAAKTMLRMNPSWYRELREKREEIILELLKHPDLHHAYELLKDRPKLVKFITDYVLLKLGVA